MDKMNIWQINLLKIFFNIIINSMHDFIQEIKLKSKSLIMQIRLVIFIKKSFQEIWEILD